MRNCGPLSVLIALALAQFSSGALCQENAISADLKKAEELYAKTDLKNLEVVVARMEKTDTFEEPNYLPTFFRAVLSLKSGRRKEAHGKLTQFKCMLQIDSGAKSCATARTIYGGNSECVRKMCGEIYLPYYQSPSRETLLQVTKFWSYVDQLENEIRAKCGD